MLIGREEEKAKLKEAYESEYSEFVAVYGRRRIGKTFLIRETFKDKFTFQYSGIFKATNKEQLKMFYSSLVQQGLASSEDVPKDWFEAFALLQRVIINSRESRKVVFIDELPWLDARNSRFMAAFEHFWNGWASARNDILLIICGSASSWIINKIFRNKGGLYNRVTYRLKLRQFSLYECEQLVRSRMLPFNRNMIMEGYMAMGGVPFYWTKLRRDKSMAQNINDLFLREEGELHDEFRYIYASMFNTPEKYIKVVEALSGKKSGLTRDEIAEKAKLENNGHLSHILQDLTECGFIRKYCHTGKRLKGALFQLVDFYTLFYYQFVRKAYGIDEEYWVRTMQTPSYHTWCGNAFERVCLLHTRQIKSAIGISGIMTHLYSWYVKKNEDHPGVQIDLIIDRADDVMNVCEIKYAADGYHLTGKELDNIKQRLSVFRLFMSPRKVVMPVLITSNGVIPNSNSYEIPLQVAGDQLFMP